MSWGAWRNGIALAALLWIAIVLVIILAGCEVTARRQALAPIAVAADGPEEFRLLEDYNGRLRLLARDPFTRRYRVVR